jgi:UDP-N-acetyl-D-glucosamine dehydrogenase
MSFQISIIGQGYVGLPLAIASAEAGYSVVGIDNNPNRITELKLGISGIEDISNSMVSKLIESRRYKPTSEYEEVSRSSTILICVPTPLTVRNLPDLTAIESAANNISKHLIKESLVILESTVEPGTTRDFLVPILERGSGLSKEDFHVAFSPERIDPMNKNWNIKNTPKIVAGLTEKSKVMAIEFYSKFIDTVIPVESLEVAETAKLLENSFRLVNISFINEISIFCQKLGINISEVINAAATKPYGFMPFYPSVGVGGHCIPVDPVYLANKADQIGIETRFIDLAVQINKEMPGYFVGRAEEKLGGLKGKKVLVVGVSYKPNVSDVRETPVKELINGLVKKGAEVSWHDDLVKEWNGKKSVALSNNFDLAILATPHDYIDLNKLGSVPILDTRSSI